MTCNGNGKQSVTYGVGGGEAVTVSQRRSVAAACRDLNMYSERRYHLDTAVCYQSASYHRSNSAINGDRPQRGIGGVSKRGAYYQLPSMYLIGG